MERSNYTLSEIKQLLLSKQELTGKALREILEEETFFALPYFSSFQGNGDLIVYTKNGIGLIAFGHITSIRKELIDEKGFRMMEVKDVETLNEAINYMKNQIEVIDSIMQNGAFPQVGTISEDTFLKKLEGKEIITDREVEGMIDYDDKIAFYLKEGDNLGKCFINLREAVYTMSYDKVLISDRIDYSPMHKISKEEFNTFGWEQYDVGSFRKVSVEDHSYLQKVKNDLFDKMEKIEFVIKKQNLRKMLQPEV